MAAKIQQNFEIYKGFAVKNKFIYIFSVKDVLFAQLCECIFEVTVSPDETGETLDGKGHHHHDHDHDHEDHDHLAEFGIDTYVYFARKPFDLGMFDEFVAAHWPANVIRCKGMCYFAEEYDMCYLFEQAGRQFNLRKAGEWFATMPKEELMQLMADDAQLRADWDDQYGDRMQKLVFIGQHLDKPALKAALDNCLQ